MVRAPVPEQIDHDETVRRRIVHVAMATAPIQRAPRVMVTDRIRPGLHAMAIRVRVATVTVVPRAPAETDPIRHDRRVMGIHVLNVATATAHIRRGLPVMETGHTLRALGVTATVLVARRAPAEIDRIHHVRPVMATDLIRLVLPATETAPTLHALLVMVIRVHAVTATGPAQTDLAQTGLAVIAPMATAHAGIGNPRAVSVVRSVRR